MKKTLRKCIICNERFEKKDLYKITKNKNGCINFDKYHNLPGRSAYICKNKDCIEKLVKNHALDKAFRTKINASIYETILNNIN